VVHYADKTTEKIEVAYGKDLRDWWTYKDTEKVTRGKVAWEGDNELAKKNDAKIRLYLYTWENPKPEKKVTSIDLVAADDTPCSLFCVAMTLENK
jgi:hypothetical protein